MSTIYGRLNLDQKDIGPEDLLPVEKALDYWKADDKGIWHKGTAGLGHLMLHNTPESQHEKLPLHFSNSRLTITADTRIDNRDDLIAKLGLSKQKSHLVPDSTLILKAYERYGDNCVEHLTGDFAFVIWDEKEQKLFCARDQMGVKPLFYYHDTLFFAFATEARGLLAINRLNREISEDYFLKLVSHLQPQKKETAYKYIFRLEAAHYLTIKNGVIKQRKYWELDTRKEIVYANKEQYLEEFRELFTEAVRCRLRSDYLIGAELSGGLDSSGITGVAARLLHAQNKKIAAFVIVPGSRDIYEDENETEEQYADAMISFADVDFVEKKFAGQIQPDFLCEMDDRLSVYGYPCKNVVDWNRYFYKKASSMQIRTMLSGHGGDQLITDYNRNFILDYVHNKQYRTYFKLAIKQWGVRQALLNFLKISSGPQPIANNIRIKREVKNAKSNRYNFLSAEYFSRIAPYIKPDHFARTFKETQQERISLDFIGDRMEYETILGLNYKICPAFPMQDTRLMEYVLALPSEEKMQQGKDRLLYRRAMEGLLPEKIVSRKNKHIQAMVSPAYVKWIERQDKVKIWLHDLHEKGMIPEFIDFNKMISGYSIPDFDTTLPNHQLFAKRKQVESIVRWFEKQQGI